ncbi:MAG: hypothetical protein JXR13_03765 [Thalassovita sp.]
MRDGVILVATGAGYVELAVQCLASLRASNPDVPVDLFTNMPTAPGVSGFDQVHPVPDDHPRAKLRCFAKARFERVLFLDCDTLVIAPLGDLFDLADRFALSVAHDVRRRSDLVQAGVDQKTPYAFLQLNSGVMLYRNDPQMAAFFAQWHHDYVQSGLERDQPALKDLLWKSDVRFYVLPPEFNLRRLPMLDAWEPLDVIPTIVHSHRLLQHLRGQGPQITSLEELRQLEKAALHEEWAADQGSAPWRPLD